MATGFGKAEGKDLESALNKEIIEPRFNSKIEYRKGQSLAANILAVLLIALGICALVFLYFFIQGK